MTWVYAKVFDMTSKAPATGAKTNRNITTKKKMFT